MNVGITCACIPVFPRLFKHHHEAFLSIGSLGSRLLRLARTTIMVRSRQNVSSKRNVQDLENANANYVELTETAGKTNKKGNGLPNIDLSTGTSLGARIDRSLIRRDQETTTDKSNHRF